MQTENRTVTGKQIKGTVSVETFRGRLRLRFRFNGQRYSMALGIPDTQVNRRVAEARARQIEEDMRLQLTHGGNYLDIANPFEEMAATIKVKNRVRKKRKFTHLPGKSAIASLRLKSLPEIEYRNPYQTDTLSVVYAGKQILPVFKSLSGWATQLR